MDNIIKKSSHPTVFQELISGSLPASEKETLRLQDEAQLVVAAGVTTYFVLARPTLERTAATTSPFLPKRIAPTWGARGGGATALWEF